MTKLKIAFWRVYEYCAYFLNGFCKGWGIMNLVLWTWIGAVFTFIGILAQFMDEDRLVAWVERHPNLAWFGGLGIAGITVGGLYWAWNTDVEGIHASAERRIGRLRLKRVA